MAPKQIEGMDNKSKATATLLNKYLSLAKNVLKDETKANMILLTSQQSNKTTVESLKADVDQAKMIRAQSCAKGV